MYPAVIEILGSCIVWANDMDFILSSNNHSIITAPLNIHWHRLGFGVVLAQTVLKVTCYDICLSRFCIQGDESAVWGNANMRERANVKQSVLGLGGINNMYCLTNTQ
jgi:hypothetical protein